MKVYFVRHGHMPATTETPLDPELGQINESLDDEGVNQAEAAAQQLKSIPFTVAFSSHLKRAHQTAEIIAKPHQLSIQIEKDLRERDTGGYVSIEVWVQSFNFDNQHQPDSFEDLHVFFKRVYDFFDQLKQEHPNETILIVSHGGVHQALYAYANNLPLSGQVPRRPLNNCEYQIYDL